MWKSQNISKEKREREICIAKYRLQTNFNLYVEMDQMWGHRILTLSVLCLVEVMEEGPQVPASIAERYKVGRTIGDGNFAIVRECVER